MASRASTDDDITLPEYKRKEVREAIQRLVYSLYTLADFGADGAKRFRARYDAVEELSRRLGCGEDYEEMT